jgi:hypothetical protein
MELASYHALYMYATLFSSIGLICSHSIYYYFCSQSVDNSHALERFYRIPHLQKLKSN